jgi:hypothetical protein
MRSLCSTRALPALLIAATVTLGVPRSAGAAPTSAGASPTSQPTKRRLGLRWARAVAKHADRSALAKYFTRARYTPPKGAHLLVARFRQHGGRSQLAWFSLGDSGFAHSQGRYWPASTVKLGAAVAALLVLGERGLDGRAQLEFRDSYGRFRGPATRLYRPAIVWSSNRGYDRLVRVAGVDGLPRVLARYGFSATYLSCPYAGALELRRSPAIRYRRRRGRRIETGTLPARQSRGADAQCPGGHNCTTLFELAELLRRVVLHPKLSAVERFALATPDVRALRRSLKRARSKFTPAARAVFGKRITIYNKAGAYPPWDQLDVALIVDARRVPRALIAASVPYLRRGEPGKRVERRLNTLAHQALRALSRLPVKRWISFSQR